MKLKNRDLTAFFESPPNGIAGVLIYGSDHMRVADKRRKLIQSLLGPKADEEMRLSKISKDNLKKSPEQAIDLCKAQGFFPGQRALLIEDANETLTDIIIKAIDEWKDGDAHSPLNGLMDKNLYRHVCKKFEKNKNVKIVKGPVPDTLHNTLPEKIAFAHIDMNHWVPEASSLEMILPKMSPGAVIVFDDYGWFCYHQQKIALDPIAEEYGQEILELPTGQGILIRC